MTEDENNLQYLIKVLTRYRNDFEMLLRVLPWNLSLVDRISQTRRWCMITRTSVGTERDRGERDVKAPSTRVHAPRSPFARGSHARCSLTGENLRKIVISRAVTGGIIAPRRKMDSLSLARENGERRRRTVGHEGWRSTEAPASTCTRARCTSRVANTRVPACPRACIARARTRAQDMADAPAQLSSRCNAQRSRISKYRDFLGPFRIRANETLLRSGSSNFAVTRVSLLQLSGSRYIVL